MKIKGKRQVENGISVFSRCKKRNIENALLQKSDKKGKEILGLNLGQTLFFKQKRRFRGEMGQK